MADVLLLTCKLKGGLGNQLFQIFTTIAYGLEHNLNFFFQFSDKSHSIFAPRKVYWQTLLKKLECLTNSTLNIQNTNIYLVAERNFSFNKLAFPTITPSPPQSLILLDGYFQSYKYFEMYKPQIIKMLDFEVQQRAYYTFAEDVSVVSLHFRLGDYKYLTHLYVILPLQYYINALRMISLDHPTMKTAMCFFEKEDEKIIDGNILCLQKEFPDWTFIKRPNNIADWEEFLLMSVCHVNVIANSTFSLFAAYLNIHPACNVYYPNEWFCGKNASFITDDLFPISSNWIKVLPG